VALYFDVLIIGSGLAGQAVVIRLADSCKVGLISKRTMEDSASAQAQGVIAAVLDNRDSIEDHIRDTFIAGANRGISDTPEQKRRCISRKMGLLGRIFRAVFLSDKNRKVHICQFVCGLY
jgi:aspartate oxidase